MEFKHAQSNTRPPYQKRWWKITVLLLSGTSLFLILTLIHL